MLMLGFVLCAFSLRVNAPTLPLTFQGGLMGVRVNLELYTKQGYAMVQLRGAPVGGYLAGRATFAKDGESVLVDDSFERALRMRFCSVKGVWISENKESVRVAVSLPLFGTRHVTLYQVHVQ